jgi:hypothetical protein
LAKPGDEPGPVPDGYRAADEPSRRRIKMAKKVVDYTLRSDDEILVRERFAEISENWMNDQDGIRVSVVFKALPGAALPAYRIEEISDAIVGWKSGMNFESVLNRLVSEGILRSYRSRGQTLYRVREK